LATLKCMLCGDEYEVQYNEKLWMYACEVCCGLSISKVIHISNKEWNEMKNIVKNGFDMPEIYQEGILYSLHDSKITPKEINNVLPLLSIIFNKVVLDGAIGLLDCSQNFVSVVNNLVKEDIISLSEMRPLIGPITKCPLDLFEDTPWRGREDLIYYPYADLDIDKAMELYFTLNNMSLALTSSEIENIYKWAINQPSGTLGEKMERLGYYGTPEELWLNFSDINYYLSLSNELRLQLILNNSRAGLFNLKYGIFNPNQKKVNAVLKLMKRRRLYLPEFSEKTILKLRSSEEVEQLRYVLNKIISSRDYDFKSDDDQLINQYDLAIESYNRYINKYGKRSSAILSGLLATIGGLFGGPLGAVIGGMGGASAPFGAEYFIKKHYSKKVEKWPFLFVKG